MRYHIHDLKRAIHAPMVRMARMAQGFWRDEANPLAGHKIGRSIAGQFEVYERLKRHHPKPSFGIESVAIGDKSFPIREKIVAHLPFGQLIHFEKGGFKRADKVAQPKVLVLAPLSGHYATLLRDTVRGLLVDHDVYITDWMNAAEVPYHEGTFNLDSYIDYLYHFIGAIGERCHIVAVCQPSVQALVLASVMAAEGNPLRPRSIVLMGGPIDTRLSPTDVNEFGHTHPLEWFREHLITKVPNNRPGAGRDVYPGFMQLAGFMSLNLDKHIMSHIEHVMHLADENHDKVASHRRFYDEYYAVMDLPAEFFLETIYRVFQNHDLARGIMRYRQHTVDPGAIRDIGLMTIEGEHDDITGKGQTEVAHKLCVNLPKSHKKHHFQKDVGHYGIFSGKRWRTLILPELTKFIKAHQE